MVCDYCRSIVLVNNNVDILELTVGIHGADKKQSSVDFAMQHAANLLDA